MKTKLIVISEHTLATLSPNSNYAGVLMASVLKGSPITCPLAAMVPMFVQGEAFRLASAQDFKDFRVSFKGFCNAGVYEFDLKQ